MAEYNPRLVEKGVIDGEECMRRWNYVRKGREERENEKFRQIQP